MIREREKGHPIASATGLLGEHAVERRKKGGQSVGAAFVPHTNWQHSMDIGEKEGRTQADEITPSDLYNQTRFFYRSYGRMRSIPHKTPEIECPIKANTRWAGERRLVLVFSAMTVAGTVAIALTIFSVCVVRSRIPYRPRYRSLRNVRVVSSREVPWWSIRLVQGHG